ncbi:MAG: pilus assembly protein PilM [Phycisphaerae bacterium]
MFSKKTSTIAIDVGLESLRVVQLRRDRDAIFPVQWAGAADSVGDDNDVAARMDAQFTRLARIIKQKGLRGRDVTIALQPPDVSFSIVDVPHETFGITQEEWDTMLRCEAARAAKIDPDQLEVVAWPLPSNRKDGGSIMVAYAKCDMVTQMRERIAHCKLKLVRIDLLPLVLLRAGWRAGVPGEPERAENALWGVLEIGARTSLLVVGQGRNCIYVRDLGVSADFFTREIAKAIEVDYAAAERIKRDLALAQAGIADNLAHHNGVEHESATATLAPIIPQLASGRGLRSGLRTLTSEARRAFTFAIERFADSAPTGLYLTGGGCRLHGLREHMAESLGVPVEYLTPDMCLDDEDRVLRPEDLDRSSFVAATGIALGDVE